MSASLFGEYLLGTKTIHRAQLKKALEIQELAGGRLATNLLELGAVREEVILRELGKFRNTRTASAHLLQNIPPEIIRLIPPKIAQRYRLLPIERKGNSLVLVSTDPGDPLVEDEIGMLTSCLAKTVVGLELRIHGALEHYYKVPQSVRLSGLARRLTLLEAAAKTKPQPAKTKPASPTPPAPTPPRPQLPRALTSVPDKPAAVESPDKPAAVEPQVQYIKIDDAELKRIYEPSPLAGEAAVEASVLETPEAPKNPEQWLDTAAMALKDAEIRDEIGDALLAFCAHYFRRRVLFIRRKDEIVGWRGEGEGVSEAAVRAISLTAAEPSVFLGLQSGESFWLAPLPPLPANRRIARGLGGEMPKDCFVLPVTLRSRVVCYLYGDNTDAGVAGSPMPELRRLVAKAGLAFQVYILKHKIRIL